MIQSRTPLPFAPAVLAVAVACALAGSAAANPPPGDYPATYSSRKAPWYDPWRIFTSTDGQAATPGQSTAVKPASAEVPNNPPGTITTPAWKWYGYGTPTPGQNPLAPNGGYPTVPGNWYTSSGATPGALPPARVGPGLPAPSIVPDPVPGPIQLGKPSFGADQSTPVKGPTLPGTPTRTPINPPTDVSWQSSPARLRAPSGGSFASEDNRPQASLLAPVPVDEGSVPVAAPPSAPERLVPPAGLRRPGEQSNSPDLPVEPAPDILAPPMGGSVSKAITPVTVRALAPDDELPVDAIRRAFEPDVRVMEVVAVGSKRMLVRLSGISKAAIAGRSRLAQMPELVGWRIEFEMVTALGR